MATFYHAKKIIPKYLVYKKFYYINETKLTSFSREPDQNLTTKRHGHRQCSTWAGQKEYNGDIMQKFRGETNSGGSINLAGAQFKT